MHEKKEMSIGVSRVWRSRRAREDSTPQSIDYMSTDAEYIHSIIDKTLIVQTMHIGLPYPSKDEG